MLDLAVRHVTERTQFGVPLGTFQAVQHRLAEVHVDLEAARAIARTAWLGGDPSTAAAAHLAAGRAMTTATVHCHQVMGAIGCTWEHDMHRFIRRGLLLDLLLEPRRLDVGRSPGVGPIIREGRPLRVMPAVPRRLVPSP